MSRKRRKFEKIYKWEVKKRLSSYIDPDTGEYEFEGDTLKHLVTRIEGSARLKAYSETGYMPPGISKSDGQPEHL